MRCPRCYAYVEEGAYSCDTCGAELRHEAMPVDNGADTARLTVPGRQNVPARQRRRTEEPPRHYQVEEPKSSGGCIVIVIVALLAAAIAAGIWFFDPFGIRAVDNSAANQTQNANTNTNASSQEKTAATLGVIKVNSKEFPKVTMYVSAVSAGQALSTLDDKQIKVSESASGTTYDCTVEKVKLLEAADVENLKLAVPKYASIYEVVYQTTYANKEASRTIVVSIDPSSDYTAATSQVYDPVEAAKTEEEKKAEEEAKKAEEARKAEEAKKAEEARKAEEAKKNNPQPAPAPTPAPTPSGGYILADSSNRLYSTGELNQLSNQNLWYARNEIYARHGRAFKSADLQNYFNGKSWYKKTVAADAFTWDMLSPTEKTNILRIQEVEKSHNSPYL